MSGINEQVINAEIYQIGPQGIPGEAATISVGTVTTGEPGTDASVTNSGTSSAAILDFVIPQGEQGLQGIQGPQGIQGLTGATGNGISSIEKIATVGLTDTYRITFTNNTYYDFEVINGSSISDIEKTNTSGLVDTYTITLTNGNTHTFTVTNGAKGDKGETGEVGNGILGVNKMSTTGLVDNYRMTFTNGTYFDFDVTNAKSIVSISKISTSGLIDTYRITFNDNTNFQFPVTNGRGVTGVTLLSWEGLEKTYRMSFNDGTHFDFAVTNGAGSQVDWGGIYGVLSQQTDLQDALVQSNGLTMGSVSTYNVMLKELIERAHSTFDLSKFTVAGSPTITDDGVASGFGSNASIRVLNVITDKPFIIKGVVHLGNVDQENIIGSSGQDWNKFIGTNYNNATVDLGKDENENTIKLSINDGFVKNKSYAYELSWDGITYNFSTTRLDTNETKYATPVVAGASQLLKNTPVLSLGVNYNHSDSVPLQGSIDLKQFSITVDGVEVFSGNKTGIDTIKPDDYTVVGTPTISADGILSNCSASNYCRYNSITFTSTSTVKVYSRIKLPNSLPNSTISFYTLGTKYGIYLTTSGILRFGPRSNNQYTGFTPELGAEYDLIGEWTVGGKFRLYYKKSTQDSYTTIGDENTNATETSYIVNFGYYYFSSSNNSYLTDGSIDLNSFKIYVDGNLVYQPCLKIPYTQSKTGSKIVDAVYRDRVNDMAEQFGYANYYTLDEDNGNFTLPQVELPGLIGNKTLRDSYYNGATYWELYSNRRLEQGGSCESGIEYTLPKPFADSNYILTIPYSSKTAISFIPSATGDFIAKGTGLL